MRPPHPLLIKEGTERGGFLNEIIGFINLHMDSTTSSTPKATPRDVFLHLLSVGTLYVSAVSLIALLFQYVNHFIPDPLAFEYEASNALRTSIATLIIVFPAYIATAWFFNKEGTVQPERRDIKIRKWLIYLTLFVSAVTVIIDLVTLVYRFLGGELSPRFGLKVLAVLVVAAGVFWYYLWDLKREAGPLGVRNISILRGAIAVVAGFVIGGFFLVGSPQNQRMVRFDQQRVNDLGILQQEVINYWIQKEALPASLEVLTNDITGFRAPKDPETSAPYAYAVKSSLTFELCADFKTEGDKDARYQEYARSPFDPYQQNWAHGYGATCFSRTIDPELYRNPDINMVKPIPAPAI